MICLFKILARSFLFINDLKKIGFNNAVLQARTALLSRIEAMNDQLNRIEEKLDKILYYLEIKNMDPIKRRNAILENMSQKNGMTFDSILLMECNSGSKRNVLNMRIIRMINAGLIRTEGNGRRKLYFKV